MKQYTKDLGRVSLVPSGMWDIEKSYDRLSLVYHSGNKFAYVAKQDVPANTSIDNKEYWQPMNVTGYADNNFINLSTVTKDGTIVVYDNIEEAIKTVALDIRKPGAVLSFYNTNEGSLDILPEYELWQFNSTNVKDWENPDCWNNIYFNKNVFVGWYINENILYTYEPNPSVGQYAYVGVDFYTSLLYQCRANGVWTNTNTTIGDFISIIVKGNVEVGPNGNWWNNGVDTGFPASVDSEVVINKVANAVLEKLKDGIATSKVTTNIIEVEEIDDEKNLNIVADKIISDAEIIIGNSVINKNEIKSDKLSVNNKTADDILLGDGSTTSLSEIKEAYLPLNIDNDGKTINLDTNGSITIQKTGKASTTTLTNGVTTYDGYVSGTKHKFYGNRSNNIFRDVTKGCIDKEYTNDPNVIIYHGLNQASLDKSFFLQDYKKMINEENYYLSGNEVVSIDGARTNNSYILSDYIEVKKNDGSILNEIISGIGIDDNNNYYPNFRIKTDVDTINYHIGSFDLYFGFKHIDSYVSSFLEKQYDNAYGKIINYITDDKKVVFGISVENASDNFKQIQLVCDDANDKCGIEVHGKTANDVLGAALNYLHVGPSDGTTTYTNVAPLLYNETDKKWYIPDEFVSGAYLPLVGGTMNEQAEIAMPLGTIQLSDINENTDVYHNGSHSQYIQYNSTGNIINSLDEASNGISITAEDGSNTQHNAGNSAYSKTEEDITYSTNINNRGVFIVDGADNVIQHTSTYSQYYSNDDTSSHTQIDKGGLNIANAESDSTTEITLEGVSVGNESAKLTKDKLVVGNASLTTNALSVDGGAGSLTASKLTLANGAATMDGGSISLANGAATMDSGSISLAQGAATLNPNALTLGDGTTAFSIGQLIMNGGNICLSTSTTGTSMAGYGIYWDRAAKDNITLNNGLYLKSGDGNGKIAYLNINPYSNRISINKPINYGVYSNICLDLWGESEYSTQGLFFNYIGRAFTVKGISLHKDVDNDSYKNAILRNMPYVNSMDKWEDKLQYTIGPKDTSFTTEYEAVAPLVQDPDDSSKWTIPSEYLPDSSGGSSDSVDLIIPKFIESVKGQQLDLYFDNVSTEANEHDVYPMRVASLSSNLVKIEKNHYRANPSASDAIFIEKYDNSSDHNIILTKSFTNYVVTNNPTGLTKNICIMGDGLISETYMMAEIKKLFDNASLGTINLIGTKTTTLDGVAYTHEGRKDWDWTHYLDTSYESKEYSGSTNAFVVDGELNFQKYMSKYFPSLTQTIDYFVICMGTKEVMTGATDDDINTIIENTKSFVDTLLSSDKGFPDCLVAILLQPSGPYNSNNTKFDIMEYQSSINKLNKALIETFDAGSYNTHVTTSGANIFINKYDGYDYKDIAVDEYSSRTVRQYNNIPYLSEIGSRQYGKGVYNKLRAFIDGNL